MTRHDPDASLIGCAFTLAILGITALGGLALLYAAVYVAASAWSAAS